MKPAPDPPSQVPVRSRHCQLSTNRSRIARSMPPVETTAHDSLLLETIARHFPEAQIRDGEIELGFGGLRMACRVHAVREVGAYRTAHLFFHLWGGRIGTAPVFASASGYGESPEVAIVGGACNWACVFGPVLRSGLAAEENPKVQRFEVTVEGQSFLVFVDGLDRAMSLVGGDATPRLAAARARFASESWLARVVLQSGLLPLLATERPTVLSVFVSDAPGRRVVEVKVDGVDWPGVDEAFANVSPEPDGAITLLRELAIVVPAGPAVPLSREPIVRTLRRLSDGPQRAAVDWPGWKHHGGALAAPLPRETLREIEAQLGALPSDYRDFLAVVGSSGAGPGYGLITPINDAHSTIARGMFPWADGEEPREPARGVLPLAHAGCGVMWILVLAGPHRGEVWVDARSSDGKGRRVAASFSAWYRDWLSWAVRDAVPWLQWNAACCATANVFSQLLGQLERDCVPRDSIPAELAKRLKPGSVALASGGSEYFMAKTPLNPCHGCVRLAGRFGLASSLFQVGQEPNLNPNPVDSAPPRKPGLLTRLTDKLRPRN